MLSKILLSITAVFLTLTIIPHEGISQILLGQTATGGFTPIFSYWELKDEGGKTKLAQLAMPFSGLIPLGENLEAVLYMAGASNELTTPSSEHSLSGVGDARIQFSRSYMNDRFLVSAGFNLPTGKKRLDISEEWLILEYLSQNYLQFPFTQYGEGFGFNALVGGATMLGKVRCGAGIMFEYTGEFEPYEGLEKYNPGDLLSMNAGVDVGGKYRSLTANLIYTLFTNDQVEGKKIFKQSPQFEFQTTGAMTNDFGIAALDFRYIIRGRNTRYSDDESTLEQLKFFGNEFASGLTLGKYFSRKWIFSVAGEMRLLAKNEINFGKSNVYGFGCGISSRPEEQFGIGFDYRYYTGDADGGRIDLTGHQITVSLTASL